MKEVELTGTVEEVHEKLKAHIGQKICQYNEDKRYVFTLISIDDTIDNQYILLHTKELGTCTYFYSDSTPIFLCFERDEVSETFDEMVKRKQEEIFRSLK